MAFGKNNKYCSFCGSSTNRMVTGPGGVTICESCVEKCRSILYDDDSKTQKTGSASTLPDKLPTPHELKEYLVKSLNERVSDIKINGPAVREGAPHIVSVSIRGLAAETVLNMLSSKGVYVSAGSACASNNPHISGTLKSIGLEKDLLESTIRISMSFMTTREEIDLLLDTLCSQVEAMRKFYRH